MMLLTAQWVRNELHEWSGVNAFLYRARASVSSVQGSPAQELAERIEEIVNDPGDLVASSYQVPPGGNSVLAYLDVIAGEELGLSELKALLIQGNPIAGRTAAWQSGHSLARCFVSTLYQANTRTMFVQLRDSALMLFEKRRGDGPLRVRVTTVDNQRLYELEQPSMLRLSPLHGAGWTPRRISVSQDDEHDYRLMRGEDIRPAILESLTELELPHLQGLGGVDFLDSGGRILYHWPEPEP